MLVCGRLESPVSLMIVYLDYGRKLQDLEKIEISLHWILTWSPVIRCGVHLFMNKPAADDVSHMTGS